MLWIIFILILKVKDIVDIDGKTWLHEMMSLLKGKSKPLVINEFDGFKGISGALMLRDVILWSCNALGVPLGSTFDVGWEVILRSPVYSDRKVAIELEGDFLWVSHNVREGSFEGAGLLCRGRDGWELVLIYVKFCRNLKLA